MTVEIECLKCSHPIPIGNGWGLVGEDVTCRKCGAEWYVYVDEDRDSNYWFGLEPIS